MHSVSHRAARLPEAGRARLVRLPAESYTRLVATIADETAAADANRERLAARAAKVSATLADVDAEDQTLRRLTELRAVIAGTVVDKAGGVGSLRAALASVCDYVQLRFADEDEDDGEWDDAIDGWESRMVMEFYGSMQRVGIHFAVPATAAKDGSEAAAEDEEEATADPISGSGVPL